MRHDFVNHPTHHNHPAVTHLKAATMQARASGRLNRGAKLWLGLSGGRDSMSLAYAAWLLELPITAIHINHHLQAAADDWQAQVEGFTRKLNLPCISASVTLESSSENAARRERYAAIAARMATGDVLMLAHHQDDQAETVLLNLFRGAGLSGLSGMSEFQPMTINGKRIMLWRPWLSVSRSEITGFARIAKLPYVDDPTNVLVVSNATDKAAKPNARAFLRGQIIPELDARFGGVSGSIARAADIVREAQSLLDTQLDEDMRKLVSDDTLDLNHWQALPYARRLRVLSAFMQGGKGVSHKDTDTKNYAPSRELVQTLHDVCMSDKTDQAAQVVYSASKAHSVESVSYQFRRYQACLYRLPAELPQAQSFDMTVGLGTQLHLPSGSWQVCSAPSKTQGLSLHLLHKPLHFRAKQGGERLHIAGRAGHWPLKKFFQSIHLPPWQRTQAHVICHDAAPVALICAKGFFVVEGFGEVGGWYLQ